MRLATQLSVPDHLEHLRINDHDVFDHPWKFELIWTNFLIPDLLTDLLTDWPTDWLTYCDILMLIV